VLPAEHEAAVGVHPRGRACQLRFTSPAPRPQSPGRWSAEEHEVLGRLPACQRWTPRLDVDHVGVGLGLTSPCRVARLRFKPSRVRQPGRWVQPTARRRSAPHVLAPAKTWSRTATVEVGLLIEQRVDARYCGWPGETGEGLPLSRPRRLPHRIPSLADDP
jgi:hypothetical protein